MPSADYLDRYMIDTEGIAGRRRLIGPAGRKWAIVLICLMPAAAYYAFLLSLGFPGFFAPSQRGLTFNSMLLHLLDGSFDVDPETIGDEGVLRGGRVYAYFGIVPALLRLPLLAFAGF